MKTYGPNKLTIDQMHLNATDAKSDKHSHYFAGKPFINGHIAPRNSTRNLCAECVRLRDKKYYKPHPRKKLTPEEIVERRKAYYEANRDRTLERQRDYNLKHKEHLKALKKKYYQKNRESILEKRYRYREANNVKISQQNRS